MVARVGSTVKQLKIFKTIVRFYSVDMVDNFIRLKKATNAFFHDENMLVDVVPMRGRSRVAFRSDSDVAAVYDPASFPIRLKESFSRVWMNSFSFIPRFTPFKQVGEFLSCFFGMGNTSIPSRNSERLSFIPWNQTFFETPPLGTWGRVRLSLIPWNVPFSEIHKSILAKEEALCGT